MADLKKAELKLYVWRGDLNGRPETPQYTLTKSLIPGEETIVFEISELIKDYVTIEFDGNYNNIKQTSWASWIITRTYDTDPETTDTEEHRAIAFRGYGNVDDGINPELSKGLLTSNTVFQNVCGETINIPTYTGFGGATEVVYSQDATELSNVVLGSANPYFISNTTVHLNPPASDIVTIDKTASTVADSQDSLDNSEIPTNTDKVEITNPDGTVTTVTIECFDNCKATPHKISFVNKFGVMQDIWFFGRKKDAISSEREAYKKTKLNILSTGASYDTSVHENVYLQNQGKERFTLHTGYVNEQYNDVIKELMVSEYVYIHDTARRSPSDPNFDLAIPISIVANSLDFKTKRKDKLIEYELQFEADSDFVQSIR